jgi:hypothetical protein
MVNCRLKDLEDFPNLEKIEILELDKNLFHPEELKNLKKLKNLQSLSLRDNKITNT